MKKAFFLTGLALLAAPARAALGDPPAPPPASTPAPAASAAPTEEELEADRAAVGSIDIHRLYTDRAYAAAILAHLDRLAPAVEDNPQARLAVDNLRLIALTTQDRPDDVRAGIDTVLAQRPTEGHSYVSAWRSAISIRDFDRAIAVVETASRNVPGVGWAPLRRYFDRETVSPLLWILHQDHQEDKRVRLAQALFRIGWPGDEDAETADYVRAILMDDRLRQHDDAGAASYAAGLVTPDSIVRLIVQTRYDSVLAPGRDRLALLQDSLAQRDRATSEALAAAPQNTKRVLDRAQLLRSLGRNADAFALIMPLTRDMGATIAAGEEGKWLINEAAYALLALGRNEEAVALMRRLAALPMAEEGRLIGQYIDHVLILEYLGLYAEALDRARMLEQNGAEYAGDAGKMWISSEIVCALAGLNRSAEAAPELERMRALSDTNPSALTRAYLCVGEDDAAAALMVRRLQSDDPESAILALQDYALSRGLGQEGPLHARLKALRDRPEVRGALGRVGHVFTLPLARTYWGNF